MSAIKIEYKKMDNVFLFSPIFFSSFSMQSNGSQLFLRKFHEYKMKDVYIKEGAIIITSIFSLLFLKKDILQVMDLRHATYFFKSKLFSLIYMRCIVGCRSLPRHC